MSAPLSPRERRVIFAAQDRMEVEAFDPAAPGENEIAVRGVLSLISPGTELSLLHRTHPGFEIPGFSWAKYPFDAGYSLAGVAESDAPGVPTGTRVFARTGHATRSNVHREFVLPLPAGLSDRRAAFLWLAKIAWTAVLQAPPGPGERAVVIGLGLVGNLAAQCMRLAGAEVVATDRSPRRCELARACGIEVAEPGTFERFQDPLDLGRDGRPALVVDAVGSSETILFALKLAAPRGRVVLLGAPRRPVTIDAYLYIMRKGLAWIGAHEMYGNDPDLPARLGMLATALADERVVVDPLVRGMVPLSRAAEAYAQLDADPEGPPGLLLDLSR